MKRDHSALPVPSQSGIRLGGRPADDPAPAPSWVLYEEARAAAILRTAGTTVLDCATSVSDGLSYSDIDASRTVLAAPTLAGLRALGAPTWRLNQHHPPVEQDRVPAAILSEQTHGLLELASDIEHAAHATHPAITGVFLDAELVLQDIWITVDGHSLGHDRRAITYLTVRAVAQRSGRRATGFFTPGLAGDGAIDAGIVGREVAHRASSGLDAVEAPGGRMPIVVGPGRGAVLIHEACCHPLEGDEVLRGSVYAQSWGQQIASKHLTITDDPTVLGGVGSACMDDEGTPSRPTPLVTDGALENFLLDRTCGYALGRPSTGNGRRANWRMPVIPRMSNTVVSGGPNTPDALISAVDDGIYAEHVGGGQVSEKTGEFVFRVLNARRIRGGQLAEPLHETTVAGSGPDLLRAIEGVGDDVALGAAKCGKHGQLVPVGVAGPTMLISDLLVGRS